MTSIPMTPQEAAERDAAMTDDEIFAEERDAPRSPMAFLAESLFAAHHLYRLDPSEYNLAQRNTMRWAYVIFTNSSKPFSIMGGPKYSKGVDGGWYRSLGYHSPESEWLAFGRPETRRQWIAMNLRHHDRDGVADDALEFIPSEIEALKFLLWKRD